METLFAFKNLLQLKVLVNFAIRKCLHSWTMCTIAKYASLFLFISANASLLYCFCLFPSALYIHCTLFENFLVSVRISLLVKLDSKCHMSPLKCILSRWYLLLGGKIGFMRLAMYCSCWIVFWWFYTLVVFLKRELIRI